MNLLGTGDLATSFLAKRNNTNLKTEFVRLTQELANGRKTDVSQATGGNTSSITSIEHSLKLIDAYAQAQRNVSQKLSLAESALDTIGDQISGLGASLLASADTGGHANDARLQGATNKFEAVASAFSVRVGAAYVFSGDTPNSPPLAPAATILNDLETATAAATTAADFYQIVDDWFNQPGGFDTTGYSGGQSNTNGIPISATNDVEFEFTASETEFRTVLKDLAVMALVENNSFSGNEAEKTELIKLSAGGLIAGETDLTRIRAEVGAKQEYVTASGTQNGFQVNSLSELKNEIVGVDLFETAARFEEIQLQLESLYLVTAKSARLSLTEYLR